MFQKSSYHGNVDLDLKDLIFVNGAKKHDCSTKMYLVEEYRQFPLISTIQEVIMEISRLQHLFKKQI